MALTTSKGEVVFVLIIILLAFTFPLWYQEDTENLETSPLLIDCKFEKCGVQKMTREACQKVFCCNLFSRYSITQNSETCKNLQSEIILKALINSQSDNNGQSGYDVGYDWAEGNDIDSTSSCSTNSDSFNSGCIDYVCEMAEYYPHVYECF